MSEEEEPKLDLNELNELVELDKATGRDQGPEGENYHDLRDLTSPDFIRLKDGSIMPRDKFDQIRGEIGDAQREIHQLQKELDLAQESSIRNEKRININYQLDHITRLLKQIGRDNEVPDFRHSLEPER